VDGREQSLGAISGSHPTDQTPSGLGASRFDPGRISTAAWLMLDDFYKADKRGVFATACDSRGDRKLAWQLDGLGLARWCGTNWGSHFFAITDEGKAFIDRDARELGKRLASVDRNPKGEKPQALSAKHESAVPQGDAQSPSPSIPNSGEEA
jgi:hypothetical protein